jgi:thiamine pyrophosphate-dependent acetolactate synthase large subunit-like protein
VWPDIYLRMLSLNRCFRKFLNQKFRDANVLFIGTTGHTAREMFTHMPATQNFYMAGNMGGALSVGYGASLAGRPVIVCGGDAENLMHLGGMATAAAGPVAAGPLLYVVFDNRSNKSTGGQTSNNSNIDYTGLAASLGFSLLGETITNLGEFATALEKLALAASPSFLHVMCNYDPLTPRPPAELIRDSVQAFLPGGNSRS